MNDYPGYPSKGLTFKYIAIDKINEHPHDTSEVSEKEVTRWVKRLGEGKRSPVLLYSSVTGNLLGKGREVLQALKTLGHKRVSVLPVKLYMDEEVFIYKAFSK